MPHDHEHGTTDTAAGVATPEHPRPLWGLVPYLLHRPSTFVGVIVSGIVLSSTAIAAAALGAWLVGGAVAGEPVGELRTRAWLLVAFTAAAVLATWWQSEISHDWAFRLLRQLRIKVYDGLERATPGRLLGKRTGDLASTVVADVNTTELFFAHLAGDYVGAVVASVTAVFVIGAFAPTTAAVTALVMVLVAVVPFVLAKRADRQGRALRTELGALNAEALDGVQGLRELTIFQQGPAYLTRLLGRTDRFYSQRVKHARRAGVEQAAADLLLATGGLAALVATAHTVTTGSLPPALTPVVVVLAVAALGPIATVSSTARSAGEVRAAAARVLAVADYPAQVRDTATASACVPGRPRVSFSGVTFGYHEDEPPILRDVSFAIEPGETVALVGRSGAGKSTCANLLLRFWEPTAGHVEIGGHDLRDIPLTNLRELVALVPQDVYLFNTSVRENIKLGRPDASDAAVEGAARQAMAHDFVSELPEGYDTACGEHGATLSGGQRQRIAIARALLVGAPVLVLDEAVSQLDTASERAVAEALDAVRHQRTTLVIAHRLSTIRSADRVVMLDDGQVVAMGTHDELMSTSSAYRDLLAAQADQRQ